ncbi:MAG: hypothetical protein M3P18_17870 [Actinomycetota bacterium]|nr:hypothetical protein [Actinomycetota bacterium]
MAAASYLAMLLIGVNIVVALRMIDNSAYEDDRLLGGITYPWAFLICAGLWLVAVLVLRQTQDSVTKGIVVGIAVLTAMVLVAAYGTDSLPLLLNAFVLVAVGVDSGRAESP